MISVLSSTNGCMGFVLSSCRGFQALDADGRSLACSPKNRPRSKRLRPQIQQEIDMPEHKTLSPTLKPPEFKRDSMGRFDRPGATLKKVKKTGHRFQKGQAPGPGRPPGSQSKVTIALKEAILQAGELAGGKEGLVGYLTMLARDNSSAYAGLLAKILPTQLAADAESNGGASAQI